MARAIGNVNIWHSWIVLTIITIVITIVSRPEFRFFKGYCLTGFGKAITPRNHEIFKPASISGYANIWRVDFFKKSSGNFQQFFVLVALCEGGKFRKIFTHFFSRLRLFAV